MRKLELDAADVRTLSLALRDASRQGIRLSESTCDVMVKLDRYLADCSRELRANKPIIQDREGGVLLTWERVMPEPLETPPTTCRLCGEPGCAGPLNGH